MPWLFLFVSAVGAAFTFNAYIPQRRTRFFVVPSFFGGWLTSELAVHHIAWQGLFTIFFVAAGALSAWPGWVGLALSFASWAGLWGQVLLSHRAEEVLESALGSALGADYRDRIHPDIAREIFDAPEPSIPLNSFRFADPGVTVTRHIPYVDDGNPRHQLDVYAPARGAERAPVLFQVHGGGWVIGNKREQALPLMNYLAARGWVCVTANYRLSPRATFPDHIVDLKRALHWVKENIADHGGDPDFVVATGGSAGGHLCSLLALTPGDPEYQPGFENADTSVRACVPFYGVYDWTDANGLHSFEGLVPMVERVVMKKTLAEAPEDFRRASPLHRIHPDAPPFFVVQGSHDSLVSVAEARLFAKRLAEVSKAPVAYAEIPGAQHAFEIFHGLRTAYTIRAVGHFVSWVYSEYLRERGLDPVS